MLRVQRRGGGPDFQLLVDSKIRDRLPGGKGEGGGEDKHVFLSQSSICWKHFLLPPWKRACAEVVPCSEQMFWRVSAETLPCWCHVRSSRCCQLETEESAAALVPVSVGNVPAELYFFLVSSVLLSPSRMPYVVLNLLLPVRARKVLKLCARPSARYR